MMIKVVAVWGQRSSQQGLVWKVLNNTHHYHPSFSYKCLCY